MLRAISYRPLLAATLLFAGVQVAGAAPQTKAAALKPAAERKPLPKWDLLQQKALDALRARPKYQPGDILGKSDAQAALTAMTKAGWTPADSADLLALVHGDDEFIVKRLRAKTGHNFMRHVARYPQGYDRLEHLLRLPRGETMTADLITNPGGYQMIEYMSTASGGVAMGNMLSQIPKGHDFNSPTGRIYTADQLLARLKASYEAESKLRK